ncbi:hypothetical protein [Nitratireductor sp. OM-1]|uniref:hypothetical protein n=1 Tax=Nitratireductor sp. OM-1 TaxID=1756988 RepID=UPI0013AECC7B|nr:hypothetical protein [Nitratireductor sp. OM-1]
MASAIPATPAPTMAIRFALVIRSLLIKKSDAACIELLIGDKSGFVALLIPLFGRMDAG